MAKAYEGFLKDYFLEMGLISQANYEDRRFRMGKALNPDIHPDRRHDDWVYDKVARACGPTLARQSWNTWLECRNQVFHYFPHNEKRLSLAQAGAYLEMIAQTMELFMLCRWESGEGVASKQNTAHHPDERYTLIAQNTHQ